MLMFYVILPEVIHRAY